MVAITDKLVQELIIEQFPAWSHLPIKPVEVSGIDNRTFRLGDKMLIRLPSAAAYAEQVHKEQLWLPILAPYLSFPIPEPLAQGHPSKHYPWHWSIYRWIEGISANTLLMEDADLQHIAADLATFLCELQKMDATGGPLPGLHNFWRGDHPAVYDLETRKAITALQDLIDADQVTAVWKSALSSQWNQKPVWIHGDLASGNLLIRDGRLAAVIDFGCMGVGDPACDLVIAWTFFQNESRRCFKQQVGLDPDTWARARGWALWKALITLAPLQDKSCPQAMKQQQIIDEIVHEQEQE